MILCGRREKGLELPLTVRIQDLLRTRVVALNEMFAAAIKDEAIGASIEACFRQGESIA